MMIVSALMLTVQNTTPTAPGPKLTATQAELDQCLQLTAGVDPDARECFRLYNNREDDRVDQQWRALMAAVGGPDTPTGVELRAEQRAWIACKEQSCRHFLIDNGTLDAIRAAVCLGEIISHRAEELDTLRQYYINR